MWHVLSFTGRFSPQDLKDLPALPLPPGEPTDEQRRKTKVAVEARARLRQAKRYSQLRDMIDRAHRRMNISLTPKQEELLALYDAGTLLKEANRLTRISGHGRLKHWDGTFLDIGGSTGGYTKAALYGWEPPDRTELEHFDLSDVSHLANERSTACGSTSHGIARVTESAPSLSS